MLVEGKSRKVFFPSDTLIYSISRDGSKNYNVRTCEHTIMCQLRMGARATINAPLIWRMQYLHQRSSSAKHVTDFSSSDIQYFESIS